MSVFLSFWGAEKNASALGELGPVGGNPAPGAMRRITGDHGADYELPGGIHVCLTPGSEATVVPQPQMLALSGAKRTPTYSVYLKRGHVDVEIPESSSGAVAVAGPADVRVISQRGASAVSATERGVFVWTERHPLLISQKERLSRLRPGTVRKYSSVSPPQDYQSIDAPSWVAGRRVWLAMPDRASVTDLSWSPVAGAVSYRIELRDASTGKPIANTDQKETTLRQAFPLAPGNYQLYVRAVDRNEMPGSLSAALPLQIVGVDVPAGAELQPDARIEMSHSQTIQLKNADGLSLKRASERTARPASEPVGIANGKPTPLMIQANDNAAEACLVWLVPRQSPVAAYVGPKWVIWPHEAVDLEVRWTDSSGHRLPDDVDPNVTVYVGIEPIDVSWNKQADVWRANLGPQPGHGPWVVRLEIRDQTGTLLARDFVEVERRPTHKYLAASAGLNHSPR